MARPSMKEPLATIFIIVATGSATSSMSAPQIPLTPAARFGKPWRKKGPLNVQNNIAKQSLHVATDP